MNPIQIALPDGKTLELPAGSTLLSVAERIGPRLAQAALAARVDGLLTDLRCTLDRDARVEIVTARDPQAGEVIRHSAEHVMADAVRRLFPGVKIDVGRNDHSEKFQYDFLVANPFSPEDLERIEAEMARIVAAGGVFRREVVSRDEARERFSAAGQTLKLSRLDDIPPGEEISLFQHGSFVDLCRGPHVQRVDQIGAFKLTEAAGAYWRGDERNPMLQRIYGIAFATAKELQEHLARLEQARARDHRRVGAELELFLTDPIAPGSPFYLPKGMLLYNGLIDFLRSLYPRYGYHEVMAPQIFRTELFETSGHYQLFHEDMFVLEGDAGEKLAVKPMNCPGHCHLFSLRKHSYRELPVRYAEFSRLHRNERSGTLTGLSRVRSMAQDDAHIFCEPEQVEAELDRFFAMAREVWQALGIECTEMAVSTRPAASVGAVEDWDRAIEQLLQAVERAGFPRRTKPGEGAFYGPKVECDFRDVMGRPWTLATLQIDVSMPERFGLRYVGRDNQPHRPAMLHRAILGSLERFIALYVEMTGGDFPFWIAPLQVVVLPIAERHLGYAGEVTARLSEAGLRAECDERGEKLGFKIREAETRKVPLMLVVGDQEQKEATVTTRWRGAAQGATGAVALERLIGELQESVRRRDARRPTEGGIESV